MRLVTILIFCLAFGCKQSSITDKEKKKIPLAATATKTPKTFEERKQALEEQGYKIFDYVEESTKDTVLMQQYYIAFLKRGNKRSQNKQEADSLQALHMKHLGLMYTLGYADISGPFGDDGDIRGITIYNTPTLEMADSLAHLDPMVKAGRLQIEIHPWWAAKGFSLR